MSSSSASPLAWLALALLAGCATHVPSMHGLGESEGKEIAREGDLVAHVKCELTRALLRIEVEEADNRAQAARSGLDPALLGYSAVWLDAWAAKVNLKLQVDESATLAPSISITEPWANHISTFPAGGPVSTSRAFSLPLAISGVNKATRTETIGFVFGFADLKADAREGWRIKAAAEKRPFSAEAEDAYRRAQAAAACPASDGSMMDGDLKIYEFIRSKVQVSRVPGVIPRGADRSPFDVFNYEVQFAVTRAGSASPGWKLYPIAINQAAPLLAGSRTRTDDMLLTLGVKQGEGLSQAAEDAHLAGLIGQEVARSLQNQPQ
jgi:hypothetical protein